MIQLLLPLLKYWKSACVVLLTAALLVSFHLARSRGEKLAAATQSLENEQQNFQSQIQQLEKARQNEKERNDFKKTQNRKLRFADSDTHTLRAVYDGLRTRQAGHIAR